jgi:hypothetical protein
MTSNVTLATQSGPVYKAFAANSTRSGTVVQPADQVSVPASTTTAGAESTVVSFGDQGSYAANALQLWPFGTNTAAQNFILAVFGWELIRGDQANILDSWHASLLASFTCTLSTSAVGLANTQVDQTQLYCDTIAVLAGNANVSCEAVSPTGNVAGSCRVDCVGPRFVDIRTYLNGSAQSANCLFRRY